LQKNLSLQKIQNPQAFIFLLLLIEGFITISLEILSIRQLLPFVGSSLLHALRVLGSRMLFATSSFYERSSVDPAALAEFSMKHPLNYHTPSNIIYVCQKNLNEHDTTIYTDNRNMSSMDQFRVIDNA
jgi:hypothetical protein